MPRQWQQFALVIFLCGVVFGATRPIAEHHKRCHERFVGQTRQNLLVSQPVLTTMEKNVAILQNYGQKVQVVPSNHTGFGPDLVRAGVGFGRVFVCAACLGRVCR